MSHFYKTPANLHTPFASEFEIGGAHTRGLIGHWVGASSQICAAPDTTQIYSVSGNVPFSLVRTKKYPPL